MLGNKQFELTNHLGNVLATITDHKIPHNNNGTIDFYTADISSAQDYYAFGMLMPGRNFSSNSYKFGFNGKLNDDEVYGSTGTFQDYGMRMYDTRVCRFISEDPITKKYPELTPYQFASNSPIMGIDLDGGEILPMNSAWYHMNVKHTDINGLSNDVYNTEVSANVPKEITITDLPSASGHDDSTPKSTSSISPTAIDPSMPDNGSSGITPTIKKPKGSNPFIAEEEKENNNSSATGKGISGTQGVIEIINMVCGWIQFSKDLTFIKMKGENQVQRDAYFKATQIVDAEMATNKDNKIIGDQFKTPQARVDFTNYLLDGTLPKNGSKDYINGIAGYGNAMILDQKLSFQPKNTKAPALPSIIKDNDNYKINNNTNTNTNTNTNKSN